MVLPPICGTTSGSGWQQGTLASDRRWNWNSAKKTHKLVWCEREYDLWIMNAMYEGSISLFKRVEGASIPTAFVYSWHVHAGQFSRRYRQLPGDGGATRLSSEISCTLLRGDFQVWSVLRSSSSACRISAKTRSHLTVPVPLRCATPGPLSCRHRQHERAVNVSTY